MQAARFYGVLEAQRSDCNPGVQNVTTDAPVNGAQVQAPLWRNGWQVGGKMSNMASQEITQTQAPPDMLWIPGGTFLMGSEDFYPEEGPVHEVTVDGFWMDRHIVTNEQFARFVDATGYITVAERPLNPADYPGAPPENLVPGALVFQKTAGPRGFDRLHQLVGLDTRNELAPSAWTAELDRWYCAAPCRPRRLRGRRSLRALGGERTAHGSRVGASRPWRTGGQEIHLGR